MTWGCHCTMRESALMSWIDLVGVSALWGTKCTVLKLHSLQLSHAHLPRRKVPRIARDRSNR